MKETIEVNMAWYFLLLITTIFLIILFPMSLGENIRVRNENDKLKEQVKQQSMLIEYLEIESRK